MQRLPSFFVGVNMLSPACAGITIYTNLYYLNNLFTFKRIAIFAKKESIMDFSDDKVRLALYYKLRDAAITVQRQLGPYLVEKYYEKALMVELKSMGIHVENQVEIPTFYKGVNLDLNLFADILVENEIIIELKSTPRIENSHIRQILTYMKLMRKHYGLIMNFGVSYMTQYGIKSFILSDFDEIVNSKSNIEDKTGFIALTGTY